MENKSILILPASIDKNRAHYIIPGNYKYLTQKIRLSDFELLNSQQKPIYFGPKGIYSLIKSLQLINRNGVVIDSMTNTDYLIMKMMKQNNSVQRDIYRYLYQNMCDSIQTISPSQVELTEEQHKQDATKIGGYIDLSFMSDYLMARNISDDFMTISIEWADNNSIENGYEFSKPPSLYIEEVLTAQPVDSTDVIVYSTIIPDKIPLFPKNVLREDEVYNLNELLFTETETRLNSYNQQIVENIYMYINPYQKNVGITEKLALETRINMLVDGVQLMPFAGLDTDAKRLAHMSDNTGDVCQPGFGSYSLLSTEFNRLGNDYLVGFYNNNTNIKYSNTHSFSSVAVNQMIQGEVIIQFASKLISAHVDEPVYLQTLAEVKRFYKRSSGITGNLTVSGK